MSPFYLIIVLIVLVRIIFYIFSRKKKVNVNKIVDNNVEDYEVNNVDLLWIPKNTNITIQNIVITNGLFYIKGNKDCDSESIPCIDKNLEVSDTSNNKDLDYYIGSYSELSKFYRKKYLTWLSSGRDYIIEDTLLAFYFYGLEYRFLEENVTADIQILRGEINRLLFIYSSNNEYEVTCEYFKNYLEYLLSFEIDLSTNLYEKNPNDFVYHTSNEQLPFILNIILGQLARDNKAIPVEWVLKWINLEPSISFRTPKERCPDLFIKLFTQKYYEKYPTGVTLTPINDKIKITYVSLYFEKAFTNKINLNLVSKKHFLSSVQKIIDTCCDELDSYSRFIKRYGGEKANTFEALLLLPHSIWPDSTINMIKDHMNGLDSKKFYTSTVDSIYASFHIETLTKEKFLCLTSALQHYSMGIQPTVEDYSLNKLSKMQLVVYKIPTCETTWEHDHSYYIYYSALSVLLTLLYDEYGDIENEHLFSIDEYINSWVDLNDYYKKELGAYIRSVKYNIDETEVNYKFERCNEKKEILKSNIKNIINPIVLKFNLVITDSVFI